MVARCNPDEFLSGEIAMGGMRRLLWLTFIGIVVLVVVDMVVVSCMRTDSQPIFRSVDD